MPTLLPARRLSQVLRSWLCTAGAISAVGAGGTLAIQASAAVFPCTEAGILDAIAAGGGPHTFTCAGPMTPPTTAEIVIDNNVVLDGEGNLTVDGGNTHRVFSVNGGVTAELRGMTVSGGNGQGGVFPDFAGGILHRGTLPVTNSTVSGNTTPRSGGGILSDGSLTLANSTVSGNVAGDGGGIFCASTGTLSVTNSTVSGNTATRIAGGNGRGGGIGNLGTAMLANSTVSGNTAETVGDDLNNENSTLTLVNTLVDGECRILASATTSSGNLESPGHTCHFFDVTDQVNVTAEQLNLGLLQDNGGPTETHALLEGSVAIDAALLDPCPETDQRGFDRPVDGNGDDIADCDIGAVEFVPEPSAALLHLSALGVLAALAVGRRRAL